MTYFNTCGFSSWLCGALCVRRWRAQLCKPPPSTVEPSMDARQLPLHPVTRPHFRSLEFGPIICGGVRAEGPSITDMQQPGGEEGPESAAPETGGGPKPESTVMDMVSTTGVEVMTEVVTEAAVGEAHGVMVCYDGSLRGWGYNRQKQAIGDDSDDTFVKPSFVEDMPAGWKGVSVAVAGAQSYAVLKPPGQRADLA